MSNNITKGKLSTENHPAPVWPFSSGEPVNPALSAADLTLQRALQYSYASSNSDGSDLVTYVLVQRFQWQTQILKLYTEHDAYHMAEE